MPFSTTIKFDVKIEKGPPPESVEAPKMDIDAYLPITMTIPVKPAGRQIGADWEEMPKSTEIVLDAGSRERVKFLLISASEYADPNCSKNPVALLLKFGKPDLDWDTTKGDDDKLVEEVIWLQGPLMFSGYTLSMLPAKLESIYVQNHRGKDIELKILLGKSFMKPTNRPIVVGEVEQQKAAQRNGSRQGMVASR